MELDRRVSVPRLISYLDNHSATRCIVKSIDWDDPHFFLSVSDLAMATLEIVTLCDFFNNAASYGRLFSNQPKAEREALIHQIKDWWTQTEHLETAEAAVYMLDSMSNLGYSQLYTCKNLLSHGDTVLAKPQLRRYYDRMKLPCRADHTTGRMLAQLGDKILLNDCLHDIYDYRCMVDNGRSCVSHIFEAARSHIPFDVLADVIATEPYSRYKQRNSKRIWHVIFNQVARSENLWTKSILLELLKIEEVVTGSSINAYNWKQKYPEAYEAQFRVCDFALLKMSELFPELEIAINWEEDSANDQEIDRILEQVNDH